MNYRKGLTATELLIIVNAAVFILVYAIFRSFGGGIFSYVALQPAAIWKGKHKI